MITPSRKFRFYDEVWGFMILSERFYQFVRNTQAGLNSGFTDLRAKSPNLNFEKARIKKLGFKVMKDESD